jgi:threonine/homoserine/homoserine lactone efflux protein
LSSANLLALFGAMLIIAIVPGPAIIAVIARTFSSGFSRGLMMIIGIALADFIFILLALFGLSIISEIMGTTFLIIKYVSATYLIWLGLNLIKSKVSAKDIQISQESSLLTNLISGLFIHLGNPKAIVFYIGLFPSFIDVNQVATTDVLLIMGIAVIAFGSINICYALLAVRAKMMLNTPDTASIINKMAGSIMVSIGALVALRA